MRLLHPFATSDDRGLISVPMGLDPAAAHAAAAFYHSAYIPHPLSQQSRMEKSLCLSALRAPFYSVPGGGALPSRHPSALHLHLPGSCSSAELSHTALAKRLQMESELHQQEWEHEHDQEKEGEHGAKAIEREIERDRQEGVDRQKERHRGRRQQMVREAERQYLAELQILRALPEDRPWPGERLTLNGPEKAEESEHLGFTASKPLSLHSSKGSVPHPVPSLIPSHVGKHHGALATAMMTRRLRDDLWLTRHRMQDRELDLCSPVKEAEPWRENHRSNPLHVNSHSKGPLLSLGIPPPLISPKGPSNPSIPATTLWNPASFVDSPPACRLTPSILPNCPPPRLTPSERPPLGWGERTEDSRRRVEKLERYHSARGANLQNTVLRSNAEQDRTMHSLYQWQQRGAPFSTPLSADVEVWKRRSSPILARVRPSHVPESLLDYDKVRQQHRRLLSKLDLEEKWKREAMEEGYYYDMDESYDESNEEEVKAHLRRVTEQPPLKLDTCSEKVEFLRMCGLTTCAQRDKLLSQKNSKRRRMLRERSPSPPAAQVKKSCPLTTPYSAEQMDRTPELGQKKDFLSIFNLSHVSPVERRGDSRCLSLPNRHPFPDSPSPSPPFLHKPKNALYNDTLKSSLASHLKKTQFMEKNGKFHILQNAIAVSPMKKAQSGQNGHSCPWEKSMPEVFAQHFHQTVLQSTPTKCKDGHLNSDPPLPPKASPLKDVPPFCSQYGNSHKAPAHEPSWDIPLAQEPLSDTEVQSGHPEGIEEGEEAAPRHWQGIEAVFEAYNQYAEEHSIERKVLQSQCKKLEAQNHILTQTVKQLSQTMGELINQRQQVCEENKRLQDQLEYFKRCLTLPNLLWSRSQVNGHTPR